MHETARCCSHKPHLSPVISTAADLKQQLAHDSSQRWLKEVKTEGIVA